MNTMDAPSPPSPPDGPPLGTNFSRRKAIAPLPPAPAFTRIVASSTKCIGHALPRSAFRRRMDAGALRGRGSRLNAGDRARAGAPVVHLAVGEREQREVAAHADVRPGMNHGADLANEDVARQHDLAGVALDAPALR